MASEMAEKASVDVGEFEKVREQIINDENGQDWKLSKTFEHTTAYRKTSNDSVFKVSRCVLIAFTLYFAFISSSANWSEFPKRIVSSIIIIILV